MECKNCKSRLTEKAKFCEECGAKVIRERITVKKLVKDFFNDVLGWDNAYFRTFKAFMTAPDVVVKKYISGTRKMFMAPLTFLALGVGIATFIFNSFSDQYAELSSAMVNESQYNVLFNFQERLDTSKPEEYFGSEEYNTKLLKYKEEQKALNKKMQKTFVKYFNLAAFLLMPLYAYLAFLTFGRRYNYGEHLVTNAYIQGFSMVFSILFFTLSLLIHPYIYSVSIFITIFYYLFSYKKLFEISWGQAVLKLILFFGIMLVTVIVIFIIAVILGFLFAMIEDKLLIAG